jgi:ankyrin repeat protein
MAARDQDALNEQLRWAARMPAPEGGVAAAKRLLGLGADPNWSRPGQGALELAFQSGQFDCAIALLERGANPNIVQRGGLPLSFALIEICAAGPDLARLIEAFKAAGGDLNALSGRGASAMASAAYEGSWLAFHALREAGAHPRAGLADGRTPLMAAAQRGEVACLGEAGLEDLDAVDDRGFSALHWAAFDGQAKMARALLAAGARPDEPDKQGRCALSWAAESGSKAVVAELLGAGAWVDRLDFYGGTPLSRAAERNRLAVAVALLEAGANPRGEIHGKSLAERARASDKLDMALLLESWALARDEAQALNEVTAVAPQKMGPRL